MHGQRNIKQNEDICLALNLTIDLWAKLND